MNLNKDKIEKALNLDVQVFETIDSTNSYAKREKLIKDTLIISKHQSKGRGRYQRSFYSPKDEGIYFSLVLHDLKLGAQLNTIYMALAITRVLVGTSIKWLNDIKYKGKKIAGILCEGILQGSSYKKMIIGVGINLVNPEIPKELQSIMGSYFGSVDQFDVNDLLIQIIQAFFIAVNDKQSILKYKQKCETLNTTILVEGQQLYAIDVNTQGHLICINQQNEEVELNAQEITQHA